MTRRFMSSVGKGAFSKKFKDDLEEIMQERYLMDDKKRIQLMDAM